MKIMKVVILICIMVISLYACSSDDVNTSKNFDTNSNNSDDIFSSTSEPSKNESDKIDLNKYISVSFEGYNLAGHGSVKFDTENFLIDHINDVSYNQDTFEVYKELYGKTDESAAKNILKYISASLEKSNKLSNGDTVKLIWKIDTEKVNTYFKWDYTCSAQTFSVEGLENASSFDAFESIDVAFSGTAPYGKAEVLNLGTDYGTYTISPSENLRNGDEVKVTFSCEDNSTMIEKYNKYPSSFEQTYIVNGLDTYVQSFTELSNEQQNKLVSDAREKIWVLGYGNYKEAKYCGNYFYTAKDKPAHGVQFLSWCGLPVGNAVCFVFEHPEEIDVANSSKVYTVITLENLLIGEDGELIYNRHDMAQSFTNYKSKETLEETYVGVFDDIMYCSNSVSFD